MSDEEAAERKDGLKDGTERRVYNLPANVLTRLRAFQASQGLTSEAEAARRLMDYALQMRDTVEDILKGMRKRFDEEKDLRVLASEILTRHSLVTQIVFEDDALWFRVKNGERGRIASNGEIRPGLAGNADDDWERSIDISPPRKSPPRTSGPSWEPPSTDLEDEIPF
jgi:hypothetical protein